jgi:lipid II:glycine glycyltransferase (peptidoglycan interpeptide bridge formation enzyme)
MKISIIDPITDSRWDKFVDSQKYSTVFHTSAWARVIKEAYGYSPRYYVLENEDQLKAAIPFYLIRSFLTGKRLVCLPFSDYCWPLGEGEADIALLLESAEERVETGEASYLEVRGWQNGTKPAQSNLVARNYHIDYMLDLEIGLEKLNARFHDSVRRGIRQAEKRGVTVRFTSSEEDMRNFYRLHVTTRKKLGVLPQPYAFFNSLFRQIISQNLGFTVMADCEGKTVAGVVFLKHKDTIYYKFNASNEDYLQRRPNHLVTWAAIKYACANNYKYFDFGRCTPEEEGLRTFKSRWGAKETNLPYYYYPGIKGFTTVAEGSARYQVMRVFSRVMPQFAFRAAGSLLYKHLA